MFAITVPIFITLPPAPSVRELPPAVTDYRP
jgi:hypothetical protein